MLYKDFVREKSHHLTRIKSAEGYPCEFDNSKGKALKDYKVYGKSIQNGTPTPETPIEIESVGNKSKNLLNVSDYFSDFLDANGNIVFNQSNFGSIAAPLLLKDKFKENTQYTLSCTVEVSNSDNNGISFVFYDSSNNTLISSDCRTTGSNMFKVKITNKENTTIKYARIVYGTSSRRCDVKISNFQIEEGASATNYIPYEKYGIPIVVDNKSKNLFGGTAFRDKLMELGGTLNEKNKTVRIGADKLNNKVLFDKFDANKRYTFIFRGYNTNTSATHHSSNIKVNYTGTTIQNGYFNSTPGTKGTWYYKSLDGLSIRNFMGIWNTGGTVFYYEECGIFEGAISESEFEPYSITQTSIFLDAPLRKLGNYVDYIDFKNQKVIRNTNELLLNGSEDWHESGYNSQITTNYIQFYSRYFREMIGGIILSNKFNCVGQKEWENIKLTQEFLAVTANKDLGIRLSKSKVTSLDEFTQWLSENNVVVIFSLPTPREETIKLPPILTQKGSNIITADTIVTPSNIKVKYVAK